MQPRVPPFPGRRKSTPFSGGLWWFTLPALAFYGFVTLVPSVRGVADAFTDWDGFSSERNFVGFKNFADILADSASTAAIVHTLIIAFSVTVAQNVIGLFIGARHQQPDKEPQAA